MSIRAAELLTLAEAQEHNAVTCEDVCVLVAAEEARLVRLSDARRAGAAAFGVGTSSLSAPACFASFKAGGFSAAVRSAPVAGSAALLLVTLNLVSTPLPLS